jgi:asparagine synthase (glutamine-hydrolysing)
VSVRNLLALAGWPEVALADGAWSGADAAERPLALAHLVAGVRGAADPVATNEDRSVRAVLAGTLYNRRELRAQLGGRHAFSGRDDAEVLTHLYEERGVQCVKALRGAFALALWDAGAGRLVLARDQLGIVPLYYAVDGRRLAAASTLPALTALGLASTWDAAALDTLLTLGLVPAPATLYPGIRQLEPGELAVWEDARLRTQRYWQLGFTERRMGREDVARLVRTQVLEALRLRQTGVVPGLLLSGGLDAAALLALAAADRRPPGCAYTAAPPGAEEEGRTAARLAAHAGVEHVVVQEPTDWTGAVDALLAAHGTPAGGPDALLVQAAAARAASDVEVALAGTGGEAVFGGTPAARAAARIARYRRFPAVVREAAEVWTRLASGTLAARLRPLVGTERLAPLEMYARATSLFLPEERDALYTEDMLALLGEAGPWAGLTGVFADAVAAGATDTADVIHYVELVLRLPAEAAVMVPAAAVGLELRFPLADHRLAQFVASVPPPARVTARDRQILLRRAVADLLPRTLLNGSHASRVVLPRGFLDDALAPGRIAAQGVFRPDTVARLLHEHVTGKRDHTTRLWAILLVTRWLEKQSQAAVTPGVRVAG